LLLVFFDDDGTRCEGQPALEDVALDQGGPNDVLGKDWDDKLTDGVVLFFFIAGSANEK
jgi:hypothetical protein